MKAGFLNRLKALESNHALLNAGPSIMRVYRLPGGGLEYNGKYYPDENELPPQGKPVLFLMLPKFDTVEKWEAAALAMHENQRRNHYDA